MPVVSTWLSQRVVFLLCFPTGATADEPLSPVEVAKRGKAACAFVLTKNQTLAWTAFCVHPSGVFVANAHAAGKNVDEPLTLVLNSGQANERRLQAKIIRSDKELNLVILRADETKDLQALPLAPADVLAELREVAAFGFPPPAQSLIDSKSIPTISVKIARISSLRTHEGKTRFIELDAELRREFAGGPLLDDFGRVLGVAIGGVGQPGNNRAVPVNQLRHLLESPQIKFKPPVIDAATMHQPASFEAQATSLLTDADSLAAR